ncbi:MAG: STAS domain-containing protein [Crocinitomicaceae bacterium]|nr:STAS domain-containing protein [Crocinitomicaceae bacterium]
MSVISNLSIDNGILIVSIEGRLIEESKIKELLVEIENHLIETKGRLILAVEKLEYINSIGINFFIKALTKARVHQGDMVLNGAKGSVLSIVQVAKMDEVFTMTENIQEALTIFKNRK